MRALEGNRIKQDLSVRLQKIAKNVDEISDLSTGLLEEYVVKLQERIKEVLKTDELSGLKISGFVSTPDYTRSSKKSYHIYINSRSVKCPIFQKAIDTVYRNLTANNKYPFVVLNLEIPPHDVDVNVHPTKKEVRYKNTNQIFNFIYTSIEAGLSNYIEKNYTPIGVKPVHTEQQTTVEQKTPDVIQFPARQTKDFYVDENSDTMYISDSAMKNFEKENQIFGETTEQKQIFSTQIEEPESKENIIGQYRETYILIDSEEGLEIVDQHIAEERYIYEKLKSEKNIISQMLFVSDVIEISTTESELIKENLDKFERFGYGIEFLKDTEIIFRKVPQLLAKANPKDILADILDNIEGDIDNLEEKILITTSCKAAVKANTKLSIWQMEDIIKKWRNTKMPYTCPHGRPISKIILHKELAGFFQRSK